mgnify:CR=1 FL=1
MLSISIDSTNFLHLTGMHHIPTLRVKPQVFFNRCLKGNYNKDDFLNNFSLDSTSYFSHRDYHSLRIEVVEKLNEVLSNPNGFVFKKIKKESYYMTGSNIDFSYCMENNIIDSNGIDFKAIIYLKFITEENNVEQLTIQSIGIERPDYQLSQLSIWKILSHHIIE